MSKKQLFIYQVVHTCTYLILLYKIPFTIYDFCFFPVQWENAMFIIFFINKNRPVISNPTIDRLSEDNYRLRVVAKKGKFT